MSRTFRLLLAVAIGAPGTILFFPAVALLLASGAHGTGDPKTGLLLYLWGIAGLFGLVGFWWWITADTWTKDIWSKRLIAALIAAGALALIPTFFFLNFSGPLGVFAFIWSILGLLVAGLAIAQLLIA